MNQLKMLTVQPRIAEQVHEAIVARILDGKLHPGERVIQEQIAEALGVSRQPVQQALLLLRKEGLVKVAPGRGLMVAPIDLDQVRHLYDVRAVVEGLAFRQAARLSSERARKLCPNLIANGRDAVRSGSVPQMIAADVKLHSFVYDLSANPLIAHILEAQWTYMQRVMAEVLTREDTQRGIWDQHERMIHAVMKGDSDEAERLAREHIMDSAASMIAGLRAGRDRPAVSGGRSFKPPVTPRGDALHDGVRAQLPRPAVTI
jgi:DNA-binding GntR family transcriptional regulator